MLAELPLSYTRLPAPALPISCLSSAPPVSLLCRRRNLRYWTIPMRLQDLKPPLLLTFVGLLVRPQLLNERLLLWIGGGGGCRVLEPDRHPVIPARLLGHVVGRSLNFHPQHAPALHLLFQQGVVILQEKV